MKKVLEIFKFLFKTRFTRLIVKKDIIIYDCVNSLELSKALPEKKYFVLSSRKEKIKILFVSKKILFFIVKNCNIYFNSLLILKLEI